MSKRRKDYAYVAHRIDPEDPQNLGDFSISRKMPRRNTSEWREYQHYHYNSRSGRLINRAAFTMPVITHGSAIYRECLAAVDRLIEEAGDE